MITHIGNLTSTIEDLADSYVRAAEKFDLAQYPTERKHHADRQEFLMKAARNIGQEDRFWDTVRELAAV